MECLHFRIFRTLTHSLISDPTIPYISSLLFSEIYLFTTGTSLEREREKKATLPFYMASQLVVAAEQTMSYASWLLRKKKYLRSKITVSVKGMFMLL